ncbi:hypothetical protein A6F68_02722 [Tsuneonella dongtanensis]|uniref:ABC transporter substrate-binding protein n=1 Tax=Tsuneonella dongtanensis TaxID=692370 RepID=A0A1B2AGE2_9SPHN|nr:substrate-binding domain-containing protein [Tsuneonella dongtanensis]ANY21212.1 hypothetical protein A6F68_02722 [Tsuneonella dongtanensis]
MKQHCILGIVLAFLLSGCATHSADSAPTEKSALVVMTSGGFAEAMDRLEPQYERQIGRDVVIVKGSSSGGASDSIPERLKRGERADVVILSREGLAALERDNLVQVGSSRDLVRSVIGMAVRKGAPVPDISTAEKFNQVLLSAPSIGYSASASGTYLSTDLWPRLGLADQLLPKSKRILSERVGSVVARGEVAIGFQQMSELLPIPGITVVGPIPGAYQKITTFSAAKTEAGARNPYSDKLFAFLTSPRVSKQVAATGLDPVVAR